MKLVWETTGDWLEITPTNHHLAAYWVDCLDQAKINKFHLLKNSFDPQWVPDLKDHVTIVNDFLVNKLRISDLESFLNKDFLNQSVLNDLHRVWVNLIKSYPKLVTLISKNSENLKFNWDQINKKIHCIEDGFNCLYLAKQHWETSNIFGNEILNFDRHQIQILFSQEGRSSFNKWMHFDNDMTDSDTNDFYNMGSEISISLIRPLKVAPPENYVEYCQKQNIPVVGSNLNLGDFSNFETKSNEIRHVFLRNLFSENNTALFRY